MYDFYPEWGPARNRDEHEGRPSERRPRYWQPESAGSARQRVPAMAAAGGPEARDADFDRPDDN